MVKRRCQHCGLLVFNNGYAWVTRRYRIEECGPSPTRAHEPESARYADEG